MHGAILRLSPYSAFDTITSRDTDGDATTFVSNGPRVGRVIHSAIVQELIGYDPHGRIGGMVVTNDTFSVVYEDKQFFYDLADNLTSITREYSGRTYFNIFGYDGNNQRVLANRDGEAIHYLYSSAQQLLGEYRGETASGKEHIYLGSQRIASLERNKNPIADAGVDQTVAAGQTVQLNASASHDQDGKIVSFAWQQTSGTTVTLAGANTAQSTFTAPNVDETLTFELTVTDDFGNTASDSVQVTVSAGNTPPVASAGSNQQVQEGVQVTLDGTASHDPDGSIASYAWQQLSGPAVTLSGANLAQPTFAAPAVSSNTVLTFELTVADQEGAMDTDTVEITVLDTTVVNQPPVANAGPDQTVEERAELSLDGSASTDSDGSIVAYQWQQIAGPAVTLSDPAVVNPTFTAPTVAADTSLQFELTVTDDQGASHSDTVQIIVTNQDQGGDNEPPVTTATVTRYTSQGVALFDISLTTNEAASTWFRLTGDGRITAGGADSTDWQLYTGPVTIDLEVKGSGRPRPNPPSPRARIPDTVGQSALGIFEFYSIDESGNEEAANREELQ